MHITRAIEREIASSISHLNQLVLHSSASQIIRVDKVRRSELLRPLLLTAIDINDNDLARALLHSPLDDRQSDAAGAENRNVVARLDLGGLDGRAVAGRDSAAEETRPVHRRVGRDGDDGDVGHDGVLREGGGAHEMEELFALACEA